MKCVLKIIFLLLVTAIVQSKVKLLKTCYNSKTCSRSTALDPKIDMLGTFTEIRSGLSDCNTVLHVGVLVPYI